MLSRLRGTEAVSPETLDLCARVEATRAEVRLLQLRRSDHLTSEFTREWTNSSPRHPLIELFGK
jgi:hypothetical protein